MVGGPIESLERRLEYVERFAPRVCDDPTPGHRIEVRRNEHAVDVATKPLHLPRLPAVHDQHEIRAFQLLRREQLRSMRSEIEAFALADRQAVLGHWPPRPDEAGRHDL